MFSNSLTEIRKRLGHPSARSFFLYLESRGNLDFNYSYYARIEAGKVLPSEKVVNTIARLVPEPDAHALILAFCSSLFPQYEGLFTARAEMDPLVILPKAKKDAPASKPAPEGPDRSSKFFTMKQIVALSDSRLAYFLFLLTILSRGTIPMKQIEKLFTEKSRSRILESLRAAKLIQIDEKGVFSIAKEIKFPPREPGRLSEIYAQLDIWDREFSDFFRFEKLTQRFILKRVSPRFFPLLVSQSKMLIDLVNASEDADSKQNDEVVMFQLRLTHGKVPG